MTNAWSWLAACVLAFSPPSGEPPSERAQHLHSSVGGFRLARCFARKNHSGGSLGGGGGVLAAPPRVLAAEAVNLHHAQSPRSQKARQSGSVASRGLDPEADRLPEAQSPLQQVLVTAIVVRYEHLALELPQ
jgi:hypothetical protein